MSDTIEARHQRARESWLFQQWPGWSIDAVEHHEVADAYRYATYCGSRHIIDTHMVGTNIVSTVFTGLTHTVPPNIVGSATVFVFTGLLTGTVLVLDVDHPTGAPAIIRKETPPLSWAGAGIPKVPFQQAELDAKPTPSAAARLRVERLAGIQAVLGLSIQALADVLHISRPGLYKWLDASKGMTLQEASRQRLASVERLAKRWRERSNAPLISVAHEPLAGGRAVFEMLTDERLDEAAVTGAFDELVDKLQAKPKSLSQRMAEAGFTRRKSGRSLPDDE